MYLFSVDLKCNLSLRNLVPSNLFLLAFWIMLILWGSKLFLSAMKKSVISYIGSIEFIWQTFVFRIDLQDKQAHGTHWKLKKNKTKGSQIRKLRNWKTICTKKHGQMSQPSKILAYSESKNFFYSCKQKYFIV